LMLAKGKKYGKTDLIVNVKDRLPFRPFIGYENSGYKVATSQNRYYVGFNWGNVFNLAQQLNFQMMTTDRWNEWRGFTASYIIPFKWRTSLKLIGNYVRSNSDKLQKSTHVKGHSYQTGFRYECPLVKWGARHMFVIGYDYKYANNFESFLQEPVYNKNVAVSQFCLGYDLKESDRYGNINANIYLYLSPGKMMTYNNDYYFNIQRAGARADYVYVNLTFERITTLGHGFSWVLNSFGQATGNKLLPSEEITIGGFDTVRGYSQNKFIGDMGFVIRNEIRSPYLSLKKTNGRDKTGLTQFLIFCDYGKAYHFNPNLLNRKSSSLLSVGPGIRETISDHFNLRVDYGFRLKKALQTSRSRMGRWHVGASLAY
jgi:hemolysin activation/secretion protein